MSKNQFIGAATQPLRNRKVCQFDKDQYCTRLKELKDGDDAILLVINEAYVLSTCD